MATLHSLSGATASRTIPPSLPRECYRLRDDATQTCQTDGTIVLRHSRFELPLPQLGASRRAVVLRLAERWLDNGEIDEIVTATGGEARILGAHILVHRLLAHSWLDRRLYAGDRPLLDIRPRGLGPGSQPPGVTHDPETRYQLSRFAIIGAGTDLATAGLTGYSPRSTITVTFLDLRLTQLLALAAGDGVDRDTVAAAADLAEGAAGAVLDLLVTAGLLVSAADHEAESEAPPHAFWSPEELAVHDRSRAGRHVLPLGGTYRFRDRLPPEPLRYARLSPTRVALPTPISDPTGDDIAGPSLYEVLADRRSIRAHDDERPLTITQLGSFLHRVGRTWDIHEANGQEVGRRPYPAGGQCCELEIYPLVAHCAGVEPGLYHYDSLTHQLAQVAGWNRDADRLIGYARSAASMTAAPQVLLVCTARLPRLMWKYEGLGYPMVLKNAGVLTGFMYLVATAMGLAPCAVGSGDSAAFAALSGLDPLVEPAIADFVLGSRVEPDMPVR